MWLSFLASIEIEKQRHYQNDTSPTCLEGRSQREKLCQAPSGIPYGNHVVLEHVLFGAELDCRLCPRPTCTRILCMGVGDAQVAYGGRPAGH